MNEEEKKEQLTNLKKNILSYIEEGHQDSVEVNDISQALNMQSSDEFKEIVKALAELEREEEVELTNEGRFRIKEQEPIRQGTFSGTGKGFGFIVVDDETDDVFIPADYTKSAMNGDTVSFEIDREPAPWEDKAAEGRVTDIISRETTHAIGEFHAYDDDEVKDLNLYGYVVANIKKAPETIIQIETKGLKPVEGEIVQVEITRYSKFKEEDMQGIVKKTVGHKDEPGIEILSIVHKHGIPSEFPEEVIEESERVPDSISESDIEDRVDLRDETIVTIDGADAKDLDDAVVVKKMDNGNYQLGVHIADVSHYVVDGSPMDQEAFERGTSSYLTDRVIPMLPQRLSNGICSLHPNVDRLTLSCEMEINSKGTVVDYDIFKSVIRSSERMTYEAVNNILMEKDEKVRKEYESLVPMFENMEELHNILEKKRHERGAIDFDSTEAEIIVDAEGNPLDIELRERGVGERLIESFMLSANETVSEHFSKQELPILYRIHARPDEKKVQTFLEFVTNFGISVTGTKESVSPKDLQEVIAEVSGKPEEAVVSMLLLRSMQQAKYDVEPIGHFGLAAEYYSHFTSPIRRYPDLILHRLIHYYNEIGKGKKERKHWEQRLPEIAEQSSKAERRAVDAERETDELKKAEYMSGRVGEKFSGTVISITGFGMFVQLPNTVEGLIHISNMKDDYYEFHEQSLSMVGTRTGKVFKIGQPIDVELTNVDTDNVQIDFGIIKDYADVDKSRISKKKNGKKNKGNKSKSNNQDNKHKKKSGKKRK